MTFNAGALPQRNYIFDNPNIPNPLAHQSMMQMPTGGQGPDPRRNLSFDPNLSYAGAPLARPAVVAPQNPNIPRPLAQSMMQMPTEGQGPDPRRNLSFDPNLSYAGAPLARPAVVAPQNQVPVPANIGVPGAVLNAIYAQIDKQKDSMVEQLIQKQLPSVVENLQKKALIETVPAFVVHRAREKLEGILREKLKSEVTKIFGSSMVDKYGPAVVNAMEALKEGKVVCSKPCICVMKQPLDDQPKSDACNQQNADACNKQNDGACDLQRPCAPGQPKYPEDCIDTCPCVVAKKEEEQRKKEEEERRKVEVDSNGRPICPCMRRK